MFCPSCHAEYREGFTRCTDCDVELVASLTDEEKTFDEADRLVRLWRGANPALHSALTAALQSAGIPFFDNPPRDYQNWLSEREHTGFDMGVANLDIQVSARHFEEAREILNELLNAPPPGTPGEA